MAKKSESETVAEKNARHQAAFKAKRKAAGFVYHSVWMDKKLVHNVKKLAVLNELSNDEQFNEILKVGLKQYLLDDLGKG